MGSLSNNEKAAIAAGLWDAEKQRTIHMSTLPHTIPDMHDPVNLFDAREISRKFRALVAKYAAEHPE